MPYASVSQAQPAYFRSEVRRSKADSVPPDKTARMKMALDPLSKYADMLGYVQILLRKMTALLDFLKKSRVKDLI